MKQEQLINLYTQMLLIRRFEEKTAEMYTRGKIGGFCHLYVGEEAVAVGAIATLRDDDYVIGAYRDHGHAIAKGLDPKRVMAELFGKRTGVAKGKGGSMHMFSSERKFFGGDGIVAGELPLAVGLAYSIEYQGGDQVVMCFFGDGAVNEGAFHEALNLASLWKLPVIFLCENNEYGMGTPVSLASAEIDLSRRAHGYNMRIDKADGMDVLAVHEVCSRAVDFVRRERRPTFVEAVTYRFRGHSMTDPESYRSKEDVKKWKENDPVVKLAEKMVKDGMVNENGLKKIESQVLKRVDEAVDFAEKSEDPGLQELYTDVLA